MPDELDREHQPVAQPPGGGETPPPLAGDSPGRGAEHGLRAGPGGDELPARDTRPDRATRFIETTRGILSYSEVAFQDINGRAIRLFLLELLRRLDLPRGVLAPAQESE